MLLIGKTLEFVGAVLLAVTVIRAAYLQLKIGRHLRTTASRPEVDNSLEALQDQLRELLEQRKLQFGTGAAIMTAVGGVLFVLGSALYLIGLFQPH